MAFVKHCREYISFQKIFFGIFITLVYFLTRFYNLKLFPIFIDELIYARWAQQGKYDAALRLISLSDGKQPLLIWLTTLTLNVISNPIIAGRVVSVVAGFITAIGLALLSHELFKNKWGALLTAFIYVVYPFALIVNGFGIYESLLGMLLVWSLYGEILLVRHIRLDISLLLGMLFGFNLLTKTSGSEAIYLLPTTYIVGTFSRKNKWRKIFSWIVFALIASLLGYFYCSILFLSPSYYMINEKNYQFIYHSSELIPYHAFSSWGHNLVIFFSWIITYMSIPILVLVILSFVLSKSYTKEKILLFTWFFVPIIWLSLFGRILNDRYIYAMTLPLFPLSAISLVYIFNKVKSLWKFITVFIVCIFFMCYADYKILTDLAHAPLPQESSFELINGWPSGEGIHEIVHYLTNIAQSRKIFIASEGSYGSLPAVAMDLYFINNSNVERLSIGVIKPNMPLLLEEKAKTMPTYVIINVDQKIPDWPMDLIMQYRKGISNYYIRLYKVRYTKENNNL